MHQTKIRNMMSLFYDHFKTIKSRLNKIKAYDFFQKKNRL